MAVGKVSFAEQLAQRCKPYFDSMLAQGVEGFDNYLKEANTLDTTVLSKIEDLDKTVRQQFDEIKAFISGSSESTESEESSPTESDAPSFDESALDEIRDAVTSDEDPASVTGDRLGVINLVAQLKNSFEKYIDREEEDRVLTAVDLEREKEKADEEKEKQDAAVKAAKSTVKRNTSLLDKINKKVHESKLVRIMKWLAIILGSAFLFPLLKPLWKSLMAELANFLGVKDMSEFWEKLKNNVTEFFKTNLPAIYDLINNSSNAIMDAINYVIELVEKIAKVKRFTTNIKEAPLAIKLAGPIAMTIWARQQMKKQEEEAQMAAGLADTESVSAVNDMAGDYAMGTNPEYVPSSIRQVGQFESPEIIKSNIEGWKSNNSDVGGMSQTEIDKLVQTGQLIKSNEYSQGLGSTLENHFPGSTEKDMAVYTWADQNSVKSPDDPRNSRPMFIVTKTTAETLFNVDTDVKIIY